MSFVFLYTNLFCRLIWESKKHSYEIINSYAIWRIFASNLLKINKFKFLEKKIVWLGNLILIFSIEFRKKTSMSMHHLGRHYWITLCDLTYVIMNKTMYKTRTFGAGPGMAYWLFKLAFKFNRVSYNRAICVVLAHVYGILCACLHVSDAHRRGAHKLCTFILCYSGTFIGVISQNVFRPDGGLWTTQ